MKKTFLVALVVLLAMLMVTCDSFGGLGSEEPQYTADGRQLVNVTIKVADNTRSITNSGANTAANYMEFVHYDGSAYYRGSGSRSLGFNVQLPIGASLTDANTVLLLGRNSDKTLLGTALVDSGPISVNGATTIVFSATGLVTDLKADGGTPGFVVTGAQTPDDAIFLSGVCFKLPATADSRTGTLTFGGFTDTGTLICGSGTIGTVEFIPIESSFPAIIATVTSPAASGFVGASGEIIFTFNTTTTPGEYVIVINIPVTGLSSTAGQGTPAVDWRIRGGLQKGPEIGTTPGYGIVLTVGVPSSETSEDVPITDGGSGIVWP